MSKNLVIVESPAKAKTIEGFLGKDYHVLSSQGHIRDIEGKGKNSIGIDFDNGYQPNYEIDKHKKKLIETLKDESNKANIVWLASDEDREGEAIAWHLQEVLELQKDNTRRIVFHEITKPAIEQAIQNPREIDYNLVHAQQARRVIDRIVGFELSPVLWKKLMPGLSAGRVQSVAVRLVVDREREIEDFKPVSSFKIVADFLGRNRQNEEVTLHTELNHRFSNKAEARAFLEECKNAQFSIKSITKKPSTKTPAPPFTTSSLQQEAARKLHFPVAKTMRVAQTLYESGYITYMRTDSVNLSQLAINTAHQEIVSEYGDKYHKSRQFHTTSKGAQEAHEAIRPTYINNKNIKGSEDEQRLYELIWKRTIASQMSDAQIEQTRIEVEMQDNSYLFVATGEVVIFDGFMRAYIQSNDDENEEKELLLPSFSEKEKLTYTEMSAIQNFTRPPFRYTEASLVKKLEELGIGRPSTYSSTIETIQQRKYVEKGTKQGTKRECEMLVLRGEKIYEKMRGENYGADSQKLIPTDLGRTTNDYLVQEFPQILSYDFTAKAESDFDEIAEGKKNWVGVVDNFYKVFHPSIEQVEVGKIQGRVLGIDPASGKQVIAKIGRRGPCIQIGSATDADKPKFASLDKNQSIYTITLEEALKLFDSPYPYTLGKYEGEDMVVNVGMFGPYIKHATTYYSISKNYDPKQLTIEDAIGIIEKKRKASLPIHIYGDIQVLNGRYGAYIKYGDNNYRIPKDISAELLTEDDCKEIIATSEPTASKKTPVKKRKK